VSSEIAELRRDAAGLAAQFRLGQAVQAALLLEPFLSRYVDRLDQQRAAQIVQVLRAMLECQTRSDWLGLADFLEYDLWERLDS
jgi:hypothetical protein